MKEEYERMKQTMEPMDTSLESPDKAMAPSAVFGGELPYLSDEELALLIAEVEAHELVAAPPGLLAAVMNRIEAQEAPFCEALASMEPEEGDAKLIKPPILPVSHLKRRRTQYKRDCLRIATAAVAAIAVVFTVPSLIKTEGMGIPTKTEVLQADADREEPGIFKIMGSSRVISSIGYGTTAMDVLTDRDGRPEICDGDRVNNDGPARTEDNGSLNDWPGGSAGEIRQFR